jgi:hypothetical protein
MRLRIILGMSAIAMLAILIGSDGYGQFKGGPGGGKKGKGGGMDPNERFDMMAQGRNAVPVNEVPGMLQGWLRQYAQEKNIVFANDQITREQYLAFAEHLKAKFMSGGFGKGKGPGGDTAKKPGTADATNTEALKQAADVDFKNRDENGDGKLNQDEMPGPLRRDLEKWDKNKDGQIDLEEYRAYYIQRTLDRIARQNANSPGQQSLSNVIENSVDDELEKRPVVYRAGKLPTKGLPPWFVQLDTDADGQVALYEWRAAGNDLEEFKDWDRDNDGFITPEEAIHHYAAMTNTPDPLVAANIDAENAKQNMQQFNMFNRGPGGWGGPGGPWGGPGSWGMGGPRGPGGPGWGGPGGPRGPGGPGWGGPGGKKGKGFGPGGPPNGSFIPADSGQWGGGKGKGGGKKGKGGYNGG